MSNRSRSYISSQIGGRWCNNYAISYPNLNFISYEAMSSLSSGGNWRKALGRKDIGNPWVKDGYIVKAKSQRLQIYRNAAYSYDGTATCIGGCDATTSNGRALFPPLPASSIGNLNAAGATAISRCAPTVPAADTLVGLAEIYREGIPKMVGSTLKKDIARFQSYGDEYLNYQFGWKPLINDLKKLSKAVYESDELIQQLTRNSGKVVRRGYTFPTEGSSTPVGLYNNGKLSTSLPIISNQLQGNGTAKYYSDTSVVDTWFNGAFTYHADLKGSSAFDRVSNFATRARHLYGIKLTPDVVWNLMPWSWLVDWETNMGDVLTNVGLFSNDGLVMVYGYVMQHKQCERVVTQTSDYYQMPKVMTYVSFQRHNKSRIRATPWGFGLTIGDLSARQIAILAALGITRF